MAKDKDKTSAARADKSGSRSSSPSLGSLPSLSSVTQQPLNPETAVEIFIAVLTAALELKIVSYVELVKRVGVMRLLESLASDLDRLTEVVHSAVETRADLVRKKAERDNAVDAFTADIELCIQLDDDRTCTRLITKYGIGNLVRLIPLWLTYEIIKSTDWMLTDEKPNRRFALMQCKAMLEHPIFDNKSLIYEYILSLIGHAALTDKRVPHEMRQAHFDAMHQAMKDKTVSLTTFGELLFTAVPLDDIADHIPALTLGLPFADYVKNLGADEPPKNAATPPPLPGGNGRASADDVASGDDEEAAGAGPSQPPGAEVRIDMDVEE